MEKVPPMRQFVRTPNAYGFAVVSLFLRKSIQLQLFVHRSNDAAPFCRCPRTNTGCYCKSKSFHELGFRINFTMGLSKHTISSFYLGCKIYSTPTSLILTQAKIGIVIIFTDRHNLALFTPALKFPLNNPLILNSISDYIS